MHDVATGQDFCGKVAEGNTDLRHDALLGHAVEHDFPRRQDPACLRVSLGKNSLGQCAFVLSALLGRGQGGVPPTMRLTGVSVMRRGASNTIRRRMIATTAVPGMGYGTLYPIESQAPEVGYFI